MGFSLERSGCKIIIELKPSLHWPQHLFSFTTKASFRTSDFFAEESLFLQLRTEPTRNIASDCKFVLH